MADVAGYYMYTEVSSQRSGDKAQLLSPRYPKTSGKCLQFWYHMYGVDIGTLAVYKKVKTKKADVNMVMLNGGLREINATIASTTIFCPISKIFFGEN